MTPVVLDGLAEGQRQSWLGLLEVARVHPDGWCLVGGQMVYLICRERSFAPVRLTNDSDLASLDLLIPQGTGGAAASRRGVTGGTTLLD